MKPQPLPSVHDCDGHQYALQRIESDGQPTIQPPPGSHSEQRRPTRSDPFGFFYSHSVPDGLSVSSSPLEPHASLEACQSTPGR